MKEILAGIQITKFNGFIYEYPPVALDWWDLSHKTVIEIGIYPADEDGFEIQVIFSPFTDGIAAISVVMEVEVDGNFHHQTALIEKSLCQKLEPDHEFTVSEEQNACIIEDADAINSLFQKLVNFIKEPKPRYTFDTNAIDELNEPNPGTIPGETLDHFFAMMRANGGVYTPRVIESNLNVAKKFEGEEYIPDLKKDAQAELPEEVIAGFQVDEATLELVLKLITEF